MFFISGAAFCIRGKVAPAERRNNTVDLRLLSRTDKLNEDRQEDHDYNPNVGVSNRVNLPISLQHLTLHSSRVCRFEGLKNVSSFRTAGTCSATTLGSSSE